MELVERSRVDFAVAVESADSSAVRAMLAADGDLWQAELDSNGETCLHVAAKSENSGLLRSLLAIPTVEVNQQTKSGSTPLHQAYRAARWTHVDLLLQAGANPSARTTKARYPPAYNAVAWLHRNCKQQRDGPDTHVCLEEDRTQCYLVLKSVSRHHLLLDPAEGIGSKQWRIRQCVAYDCSVDQTVSQSMCDAFFGAQAVPENLLVRLQLTQLQQMLRSLEQPQKLPYFERVQRLLDTMRILPATPDGFTDLQADGVFLVQNFPFAPLWDLPENGKFLVTRMQCHPSLERLAQTEKWAHLKWKKNTILPLKPPYPLFHRQNATSGKKTANSYSYEDVKVNANAVMFVHTYTSESSGCHKPKSDEAKERLKRQSKRSRGPDLYDFAEQTEAAQMGLVATQMELGHNGLLTEAQRVVGHPQSPRTERNCTNGTGSCVLYSSPTNNATSAREPRLDDLFNESVVLDNVSYDLQGLLSDSPFFK